MPEQDLRARQLQEAEKVPDVIFPAGDEPAGVVEPGEEAFDFPAAPGPPQGPAVSGRSAAAPVGGDHLDAVPGAELRVQEVAVVPAVAD